MVFVVDLLEKLPVFHEPFFEDPSDEPIAVLLQVYGVHIDIPEEMSGEISSGDFLVHEGTLAMMAREANLRSVCTKKPLAVSRGAVFEK